jgi:hypothetical protein
LIALVLPTMRVREERIGELWDRKFKSNVPPR